MFKNSVRLLVTILLLALATPATRANDLACTALLCLSGGSSCSNSKFPGCAPAIGQYCKLMKLAHGFSKATDWLNKCEFEGSPAVATFATNCTAQRIFSSLYSNDIDGNVYAELDVPEICKKFPEQVQKQNQSVLATMSPNSRHLIQDTSLLPVLSMQWKTVYDYADGGSAREIQIPIFSWNYAEEIPVGYTKVYDPNTNTTSRCPKRFIGDTLSLTFTAKVGCQ